MRQLRGAICFELTGRGAVRPSQRFEMDVPDPGANPVTRKVSSLLVERKLMLLRRGTWQGERVSMHCLQTGSGASTSCAVPNWRPNGPFCNDVLDCRCS